MIEGRPRESLVQYENPIEVSTLISYLKTGINHSLLYRSQEETKWTHSRRVLVSIDDQKDSDN